jgi:hypothetical protein
MKRFPDDDPGYMLKYIHTIAKIRKFIVQQWVTADNIAAGSGPLQEAEEYTCLRTGNNCSS